MWGKHRPWNSTYRIAAILTITQTNIWILITPFLTQVSSLKKKASGLQTSLVYIFSFFRQRKGAHPMFIRPLVVIACGLLQNGKNIHHLDNVRKVGARV